jgi:hypothetical protein
MGLFTWVILMASVLVILGLGVGTYASGMFEGSKSVAQNPVMQDTANQMLDMVKDEGTRSPS